MGTTKSDRMCLIATFAYNLGFDASIIMEAHLALSFIAAIYRWPRVLHGLRWALWCVWPVAIGVASAETFSGGQYWTVSMGCCGRTTDFTLIGLQTVTVCVTITCYTSSLAKTCLARHASSNAVQMKVWRRVHTYLLAWLLCDFPEFVTLCSN